MISTTNYVLRNFNKPAKNYIIQNKDFLLELFDSKIKKKIGDTK